MAHARRAVTYRSGRLHKTVKVRRRSPKATTRLLPASGFQPQWGLSSFFRSWAFGKGRRKHRRLYQ